MKRTLSLALVLGGLALLAPAAAAQTPTELRTLIDEGTRARGDHRYKDAVKAHYFVAVYCLDASAESELFELGQLARLELGFDYLVAHYFARANAEFLAVLASSSDPFLRFRSLMGFGASLRELGLAEDSASAFDAAAQLTGQRGIGPTESRQAMSGAAESRLLAAVARAKAGDQAGAEAALVNLILNYASFEHVVSEARYQLGLCLLAQQRVAAGRSVLESVVAEHANQPHAQRALERLEKLRDQYGIDLIVPAFAIVAPGRVVRHDSVGLIKRAVGGEVEVYFVN